VRVVVEPGGIQMRVSVSLATGLSVVLGAAVILGPVPTASAAVVSVSSGVLYDECRAHPYTFSFTLPAGTDSWTVEAVAVGPDGTTAATDVVLGSGASAAGTGALEFCGTEQAGAYELRTVVVHRDVETATEGSQTSVAPFTMRTPRSRSTLKVSDRTPRFNQHVRFVMKSQVERPSGYAGTVGARMHLEVRVAGTPWISVKGSRKTTDSRGRATKTYRWNIRRPLWLRTVTETARGWTTSASRPVRVG
jgi:hypothetical protein